MFLIFYGVYAVLVIALYTWLLLKLNHKRLYQQDLEEKYLPFRRNDRLNWNLFEIYFCALVILPFRAVGMVISLLIFQFTFLLGTFDFKLENPWPKFRFHYFMPVLKFLGRINLFFSGFHIVKHEMVKYSDYDPKYVQTPENLNKRPSIIVSNHFTWYDTIIYVTKYLPSYLSKAEVKSIPVYGWITTNLKSIYVQREDNLNRNQVLQDIRRRIKQINEGQLFPPVLIFPEGTTSNGQYLLSFKKGAFEALEPIKITCLKYNDRNFNLALESVLGMFEILMFSMVQFWNEVEIIEFEGLYDPKHLNLENYPEEQRWQIFADKAKDIMAKCLNVQKSESGFREKKEYLAKYFNQKQKSH